MFKLGKQKNAEPRTPPQPAPTDQPVALDTHEALAGGGQLQDLNAERIRAASTPGSAESAATLIDDKTAAAHAGPIANNQASAPASGETPARQLTAAEVRFAVAFTRILSVLMKSDPYRKVALGQIEQFIAPPLLSGQFAILDARINGQTAPVAVAFWAHVSPEVDRRLSDTSAPAILQPPDWRSGNIPWLIDIVGQPQAVGQLMQQLKEKAFAGREVKMRRKDADGRLVVGDVGL